MEIYAVAPEIGEKALEKRKTYIETLVKKANEEGVKAEGFLRQGLADEKIIEVAKEIEAELLVMGTYGRTGIKRLLMGGTTERVLSIGALPVLVVK
jgi:nucleotide-binding universal stress UspA family protein